MDKKVTLSEIIEDDDAAIHCPKEEQAEAYAKAMDERGRTWINGDSYIKNNKWSVYKEETCYWIWAYALGSFSWYKEHGFKIYEFDDVDLTK
jgi:hypothetical protein